MEADSTWLYIINVTRESRNRGSAAHTTTTNTCTAPCFRKTCVCWSCTQRNRATLEASLFIILERVAVFILSVTFFIVLKQYVGTIERVWHAWGLLNDRKPAAADRFGGEHVRVCGMSPFASKTFLLFSFSLPLRTTSILYWKRIQPTEYAALLQTYISMQTIDIFQVQP